MAAVIQVNNLKKYFGATKAVDDISFSVDAGEIYGFLGPNGAGKTTTIRCMMDLLRPDEGSIKILGLDARTDSEKLKTDIGFLSGEVHLYDNWSGQEHIALVKKMRDFKNQESELIKKLNFDPRKKVKKLSSGNKQKLGLILALMHQPKILMLDEPTLGLDPLLQIVIYEILKGEAEKGHTIFMSSHNLAEVERICDRVCIIKEGKIAAIESIREIKKKRIYTAYVYFDDVIPKEEIIAAGIEITKEFEDGLVLNITGDPDPLINILRQHKLKDLEIVHASLEEVFVEFYR